jgi:uncharacterized protein DUF5916
MFRTRAYFVLSLLAGGILAAAAPAVAMDHAAVLSVAKTAAAPALDASLSSPAWSSALKATSFEDFNTRQPAKYETDAYFLYDDKNLYVGFHARQAGTPITATQNVDNAGVLSDDHVAFSLDTSGNGSRVYSFKVTPKGIHDETSSENARYAPQWTSVARVTPEGDYDVMMIIPLSVIRAQSAPVQRWKINFVRFVAATNDEYTWAYEAAQTSVGDPTYWPAIDGVRIAGKAARPQPRADVYALGSIGSDRNQFQDGIGRFEAAKVRTLGIDATYPITNTLSFVGTLNPDFSNVEQDQTSIAPQMFQRQYREYRPFFAQGAQYINALPSVNVNGIGDTLFYTPGIGIFNRGLKLEGTAGRNAVGVLNVAGDGFNDTAFGYSEQNPSQTLGFGAEGVIADHAGQRDAVGGVSMTRNNTHSGEFTIAKFEHEQNSLDGGSKSLFASEGLQTATYFAAVDYRDISPNFDPIDGYTAISDIRGPRFLGQYNGVGAKGSKLKSWGVSGLFDRFVGVDGSAREYDANVTANVLFDNGISAGFSAGPSGLPYGPDGSIVPFSLRQVSLGYKDGSPKPVDASYAWGPFGGGFLQQATFSTSQQFGLYGISFEYDGTVERNAFGHAYDTQWFRRASLTRSFGRDASLAIGLRSVSGDGGFAQAGTNLAISFHKRFANMDELYIDYGTPAAPGNTIHRLIAKYVFHAGGAAGT